jgi:hypothetical protein
MKKALLIIILTGFVLSMLACSGGERDDKSDDQDVQPTATQEMGREPRVITGEEALELYGIEVDEEVQPTRTPIQWFPLTVWVNENVLPYDPNENVDELAVFTRWKLSDRGTWLGDLKADTEVTLFNISEDGTACLIEGMAIQGWEVRGWVACNRLDFHRD